MNILFTRFPLESAYGGAEVQTLSLIRGLKERGHEVMFLGSCPVLLTKTRELGIRNYELGIGSPPVAKGGVISFSWRRFGMQRKLIAELEKLLTTHYALQTIVMLSMTEKLLLTPWAVERSIKVIWLEHDPVGRWLTANPWLPRLRQLSKQVTTVVVSELSKNIYTERLGWSPEKIIAIPNGIETRHAASLQTTHNSQLATHDLHITCIARLAYEKGIDILLNAIRTLPHIHLTIVGTGTEESTIRRRIVELELGHRCTILAPVSDLQEVYRYTDILVLPSRTHDPFGMVAAEAMMRGIAVIVTDACGIAGYLTSGKDAMVVPAESSDALRRAIEWLTPEKLRQPIAAEGKKTAEREFSIEKMVEIYEKILES